MKISAIGQLSLLTVLLVAPLASAAKDPSHGPLARCRIATIEGEVERGREFRRSIGSGLDVMLQPVPSGWRLLVLPARELAGEHDYAELATPPYRSVTPLLIGTEFGFRAQDAIAWNPRRFHFAADRESFAELLGAYNESQQVVGAGPASEPRRLAVQRAESRLVSLTGRASAAEFRIVDARLVPGIGDQSAVAGTVALHLNASDHRLDQPVDGKATPLGQLNWLRFRLRVDLPTGFKADPGVAATRGACL